MRLKIYTEPAIEPVSLQELKNHLRLSSGSFADNLTTVQSIVPGSHAIVVGYALLGASADVLGYSAVVILDSGSNTGSVGTLNIIDDSCVEGDGTYALIFTGANTTPATGTYTILSNKITATSITCGGSGYATAPTVATQTGDGSITATIAGTVDVKIQESDDNATWGDWTGGAFTQVTTANDNAIYEKAYTGTKQYIRVVAKVLLAPCEFGVSIAKYASDATEDDLLTALITSARQHVEAITRRALITQTWDAFLDEFPGVPFIEVPFGKFQSVTASSFTYTDSAGTTTIMVSTTDFLVDTSSDPGRIILPYGVSWPSFTPYPVNPITFRFTCGYGATSASVPAAIRTAIKMFAADLYEIRETQVVGQTLMQNKAAENLIETYRLRGF